MNGRKTRFAAVIPLDSVRDLFDVITPIVNRFSSPIELEETTIRPDVDVGISLSPLDGLTPENLLDRARAALSGPRSLEGVHVFSHEEEKTALRRHTIEQCLEPALLIDKIFIDDLPHDPRAVDLVDGIIRIAHGLGVQVVAEGVEHEAQRSLLRKLGCDVVQGYLFSRPLVVDDALTLLQNWPQAG